MTPYYQRAGVTLYHADCRDVLPGLPQGRDGVDLLLTDPPYGVGITTTGNRRKALALPGISNDRPEDAGGVRDGLAIAWSRLKTYRHAYVFGPFDMRLLPHACAVCDLVWDKGLPTAGDTSIPWYKQHEPIQFAMRSSGESNAKRDGNGLARLRRGSVLRFQRPNSAAAKHHITEKPINLLRELMEASSRHGETVLDPFAGSGSTLVAALIEGRQAIGIELDEPWCEVAAKRLDALTAQGVLFGGAA